MSLIEFTSSSRSLPPGRRMARKAGAAAGIPALAIGVVLSLTTE